MGRNKAMTIEINETHEPTKELRIGDKCPQCGAILIAGCDVEGCHAPVETYSRVVGYLRPISHWNDGKAQEFLERREFLHQKSE